MIQVDKAIAEDVHLRPLGSRIVVMPVRKKHTLEQLESGIWIDTRLSDGGVALPDTVENEPIECVVVALGDGIVEQISDELAGRIAATICGDVTALDPAAEQYTATMTKFTQWTLKQVILEEANKPRPFQVKLGDRVLVPMWMATTVIFGENEYNVIEEDDIVGTVGP